MIDCKNAKDAITVNGLSNTSPKLNLNACIINNPFGFQILSNRSSIHAVNCLIYNCGSNGQITEGGNYGGDGIVTDEISIQQAGNTSFTLDFENDLYKGNTPALGNIVNCLQNEDPLFVNIDAPKNEFDFHLQSGSPCINTGKKVAVTVDLDGISRDANPDIGCYESK